MTTTPRSEPSTSNETELTERSLPVLPVRDTVLFPHAVLPLTVGRESSVQLINSLGEDKTIIVVAQREARVDNPQPTDLFAVGTLAVVHKVVKMPNQSLFVFAEGLERVRLTEFTQLTPFMDDLVTEAKSRFAVREIVLVHRLGRLEIGETSVLIVVASAHRGAAFEACRWVIDTLKKIVPIWKKEFFEDGAVWADGEPFPAEILPRQGTPAGPDASK